MTGRQIAEVCAAFFQRVGGQALAVNVHQRAGNAAVLQDRPRAEVAGVLDGRHAVAEQVRQAPEQILNARADDDLLRRAFHTAVHRQIFAICVRSGASPCISPRCKSSGRW